MTYIDRVRSKNETLVSVPTWVCHRYTSGVLSYTAAEANPPDQFWTDTIRDKVVDKTKPIDLSKRLHVKNATQLKFKVLPIISKPDWYKHRVNNYLDDFSSNGSLAINALRDKTGGENRFFSKDHRVGDLLPSINDIETAYANVDVPSYIEEKILTDKNLLAFEEDLNLLATIGELAEIRGLIDLFLPSRSLGSGVNKILDPITEKYLGYSFGLVPMFKDMLAIIERIKYLDNSIAKWNEMAAKGMILNEHAYVPLPDSLKNHPRLHVGNDGSPLVTKKGLRFLIPKESKVQKNSIAVSPKPGKYLTGRWRYSEFGSVYVKATASIYFKPLPLLSDDVSALELSIWGLDKPLSAAWELVPFSFVVDWFISIGDAIDRFETEQTLLKLEVVDACFSTRIRVESIAETYMDLNTSPVKVVNSGGLITIATSYKRSKIAPKLIVRKPYFKMEYSLPTTGQTVLGSALLWQLLCSKEKKVLKTSVLF